MVFPFKQLRRLVTRKKVGDKCPSNTNSQTSQVVTSSVFPISFPMTSKRSAPPTAGETETRAYVDGEPYALTQLYHAQVLAVDKARRSKTPAHGPSRYSIRAMGHGPTMLLASEPGDPEVIDQLLSEMAEAEQCKRLLKLPPFLRGAGGFVPLRELVGREVNLAPSPTPTPRVSASGSAILDDLTQHEIPDSDGLPLGIFHDETGDWLDDESPGEIESEEESEEVAEEYEPPPTRRGTPTSWPNSDSDEEDDDGVEEDELSLCRFNMPVSAPLPLSLEPISQARVVRIQRLQGPILPCRPKYPEGSLPSSHDGVGIQAFAPDLPQVYAKIIPLPARATGRRSLVPSSKTIQTAFLKELREPSTDHHILHHSPFPQVPVHHYTNPAGRSILRYICQYLSLPTDLPACELLVFLLKLHRSVRLDAAKANPPLVELADDINWEGIGVELMRTRPDDNLEDIMASTWDFKMISTFLETGASVFTWDADDILSTDSYSDDSDDDDDDELEREITIGMQRRGAIFGDESRKYIPLKNQFWVRFNKVKERKARRRQNGGSPRLLTWKAPGRSPLADEVRVIED